MDDRKKTFIKNKLAGMDLDYFGKVSEHLSEIGKTLDRLCAEERQAFLSYTTCCFNIAEMKYLGYWELMEEGLSDIEERAIEDGYKEKIMALEAERQKHIAHIKSVQEQLFDITKQPFPLERYDNEIIHEEAS